MNETVIIAIITAVTSSSVVGFIQFLISRKDAQKQSKNDELEQIKQELELVKTAVCGQCHDRLVHACKAYISSGSVSIEDYNDVKEYLYDPYIALGGNGSGEEYFKQFKDLPRKTEK